MFATEKKRKHIPLYQFLSDTQLLLANSLSPDILPALVARGYTQAEIEARLADVDSLRALHEAKSAHRGDRIGAKDALKAAKAKLHEAYIEQVALARIAFKGDVGPWVALELDGRRKDSYAGYISQGLIFCNNLLGNAGWLAALAPKGVQAADVEAVRAGFEELRLLWEALADKDGTVMQTVRDRNAVYYSLRSWAGDFRKVARIALRKNPQMCEQLGIKVMS